MWNYITFGAVFGVLLSEAFNYIMSLKEDNGASSLEKLKNALLAHALMKVKKDDFLLNFKYSSFDGTKLPTASGTNTENACFSYILSKKEFRKSPFYTAAYEEKINAIDKYLNQNLNTDEKVVEFFKAYTTVPTTPVETSK